MRQSRANVDDERCTQNNVSWSTCVETHATGTCSRHTHSPNHFFGMSNCLSLNSERTKSVTGVQPNSSITRTTCEDVMPVPMYHVPMHCNEM